MIPNAFLFYNYLEYKICSCLLCFFCQCNSILASRWKNWPCFIVEPTSWHVIFSSPSVKEIQSAKKKPLAKEVQTVIQAPSINKNSSRVVQMKCKDSFSWIIIDCSQQHWWGAIGSSSWLSLLSQWQPRSMRTTSMVKEIHDVVIGTLDLCQRAMAKKLGISLECINKIHPAIYVSCNLQKMQSSQVLSWHICKRKTHYWQLYEKHLADDKFKHVITFYGSPNYHSGLGLAGIYY